MNRGLSTTTPGTAGLAWAIRHLEGTARAAVLLAVASLGSMNLLYGQSNPGEPLYCQPQEGITYLIVNGGSGVFTSNADCYGGNIANDTDTTIATSQGGTMTRTASTGNYIYTPPTPGFTGLDTFPIHVTTVWNSVGGTGSAGGSTYPGGPANFTITLNVIPATTTLTANGATLVPIPAGSVTGCSAPGNSGAGPAPGAVYGCITGLVSASGPAHGSLATSGHTLTYTPTSGYSGSDSFTYETLGVNNDGSSALESGPVTVQVTVTAAPAPAIPTLGTWGLFILFGAMLLFGLRAVKHQTA